MDVSNGEVTKLERNTIFVSGTNRFRYKGAFGRVIYHEFRGLGIPNDDIGEPGDVYVDLTPDAYTLYARKDDWTIWEDAPHQIFLGSPKGHNSTWKEISHPFLRDTYLWIHKQKGIIWTTRETIQEELSDNFICHKDCIATNRISEFLHYERTNLQRRRTKGSKRIQTEADDRDRGNRSKRPKIDDLPDIGSSLYRPSMAQRLQDHPEPTQTPSATSTADYVARLEADLQTILEQAPKLLEEHTQLQFGKDKAQVQLGVLVNYLRKAYHRIKTQKETADFNLAAMRRQRENAEKDKTSFHDENAKFQQQIKDLLAEREGRGKSDAHSDGLADQKLIAETPYLHGNALDGLSSGARSSIDMGTNTFVSVIKDKEAAVRSVTEEAENKLADRDAQIHKLSAEVQEHKDARAQLVKEHAEQEVHMQTWLQSIPKFGRAK